MKRFLFWTIAAVLTLLFAAALLAGWAMSYLSSESFHALVEDHAGASIGGKADFSPVQLNGEGAYGQSFRFLGGESSTIERIDAQDVRAHWDWWAWVSGTWRIDRFSVESLSASFTQKPPGTLPLASEEKEEKKNPPAVPWIAGLFPSRIEVGPLRIFRAQLQFEGFQLNGSSLEIIPDSGSWDFSGIGGTVDIPSCPPLAVESFKARYHDQEFTLLESSLKVGDKGRLQIAGTWPGGLSLNGSAIRLKDFPDWRWKDAVSGDVSGTAEIRPKETSGQIEVSDGSIEAQGWFRDLATLAGLQRLQRLPITKASARFQKANTTWHWTDVFLESEGLLCLKGRCEVAADRRLSGNLQVGISHQLAAKIPGGDLVFQDARDGYFWTPVALGGTLDSPTEDLSPRLAVALGGAVIESVQPLLEAVPDNARDAVGETLDTFLNFLGR